MGQTLQKKKIIKDTVVRKGIMVDTHLIQYEGLAHDAEVYQHPGGVVIAATMDEQNFYLVEQFRYAADEILLEFPAGKLDPHEEPDTAAQRELREEIGYEAKTWVPLGFIYTSPAILTEVLYLYYATDLTYVGQDLDENEELNIKTLTLEQIETKIMNQELNDAKTLALAYRLKNYLKGK